jgi:hypothetical protein
MYKLCFYVPESHLDAVKAACFKAGAGRIGNYDSCAWQVAGQGQFRPLAGSSPFLGEQDQLHCEPEYKVEMVCDDKYLRAALDALRSAHPYEEPAYDVWRLESF